MSTKGRLLSHMGPHGRFKARDVHARWMRLNQRLDACKQIMWDTAPDLIEHLISNCGLSLRQVARRIKRSPTLVSQIRNGHQACCPLTFGLLLDLLPPEKERTEDE